MIGGGGEAPPPNGGEFLLRLLKNSHQYPSQPQQSQLLTHDPAVAEIGPSVPIPYVPNSNRNGIRPPWTPHQYRHAPPPSPQPPPPSAPHNYFVRNLNLNPESVSGSKSSYDNRGIPLANQQEQKGLVFGSFSNNEGSKSGFLAENPSMSRQGYVNRGVNGVEVGFQPNSADFERDKRRNSVNSRVHVQEGRTYAGGDHRLWDRNGHKEPYNLVDSRAQVQEGRNYSMGATTAFPDSRVQVQEGKNYSMGATTDFPCVTVRQDARYTNRRGFEQNGEGRSTNFGNSRYQSGTSERENKLVFEQHKNARWEERKVDNKVGYPVFSPVSTSRSVSASSGLELDNVKGEIRGTVTRETTMRRDDDTSEIDLDNLKEQLEDTLDLGDEVEEKIERSKHHKTRDKEYRSDKRGQSIMGQRMRYMKRQLPCRGDIEAWNIAFLGIYESLIPAEEEKLKQKQLLAHLENIVDKEWPGSRLYLYGSCANSFGFPKSDLDVCLTIDDADISKSKVLLKLADLLQAENFVNVQALTRARVPIVKLMDPTTGISCDICVNNVLAVVNTKLLQDYGEIDVRVRQLAFMVKHWAKSRGVNETYQGTLSSYAYVLMCIHFLQLRRPAILPCLQEMPATYSVNVENIECAFFDRVEQLVGYGSHNRESISGLLWSFFQYWAYCHDYTNDVISVRTGRILSKRMKDWTRRIGNDRHLICIEDPFELSHDLGRVVDKRSIKVLREEFERAAEIMQYDPNPCVTLFEPYVPS